MNTDNTQASRFRYKFIWLITATLFIIGGAPFIGMTYIPLNSILDPQNTLEGQIFWSIRIPRVIISTLAGSALALSGMAFQAVFRNALATPFTLGVASGASLGAASYIWLGLNLSFAGFSGQTLFAFLGATLSISLVYTLTQIKKGFSTATMLLAGVAINFFFSSVILFTQYFSNFTDSTRILRWLMGGLEVIGFESVATLLPFVVIGCAIVFYLTRELNLLTVSEEVAISRGVNAKQTKLILFFATSLMVGGVVSLCGPIGFVGMMAPHICRLIFGADHSRLSIATLLFGGLFLTACDTVARTVIAPAEMPVGIITALLGGPFFIWLLISNRFEKQGM